MNSNHNLQTQHADTTTMHDTHVSISGSLLCQTADNALGRTFRSKTGEFVSNTTA